MNAIDIINSLSHVDGENVFMQLGPGPLSIMVGPQDRMAAELLQWIGENWSDRTNGEVNDALQAVIWWSILFESLKRGEQL